MACRWPSCHPTLIQRRFNPRSAAERLSFSTMDKECSPLPPQHVGCLLPKPLVQPCRRVEFEPPRRGSGRLLAAQDMSERQQQFSALSAAPEESRWSCLVLSKAKMYLVKILVCKGHTPNLWKGKSLRQSQRTAE